MYEQKLQSERLPTFQTISSAISLYTGRVLFVGGLPTVITSHDLFQFFAGFGPLDYAQVSRSPNLRSKGFGYVMYSREEDADWVLGQDLEIYNKSITVERAIDPQLRLQLHKNRSERKIFIGGIPKTAKP